MRYYKIKQIYADNLNMLMNAFSSKEAKMVGLTLSILSKMRFRGIIKRIQYRPNKFIWKKVK